MRNSYSLQFYCRESKKNKQGMSPVEVSLTLNGKRTFIQLPVKERPEVFARKRRPAYLEELLEQWRVKVIEAQTAILKSSKPLTVDSVKECLRTGGVRSYRLSDLRRDFLKYQSARWTANDISYGMYKKYELESRILVERLGDVEVMDITSEKAEALVLYIKKVYKDSTAHSVFTRMKSMFIYGMRNRKITYNPLDTVKMPKAKDAVVETITYDEYERIRDLDLSYCERLERVRDLFLFSCGTGLAYCDTQGLKKEDFRTAENGQTFISKERAKTGVNYTVVVLPEAMAIAEKYNFNLPKISNQKVNSYLKAVQDLAGVKVNITFHKARHFAARTMLNKYHFPLEIVARVLGHKNASRQTSHYAKLYSTTVFDYFQTVSERGL